MQCPHCGFGQSSDTKECIKCGVIFAKYSQKRNPKRTPSQTKMTVSHAQGPWRDSRYLVLDYSGTFPSRCFKCNNPTDEPERIITVTNYSLGVDIKLGDDWSLFLMRLSRVLLGLIFAIITESVRLNHEPVGVPVILCKRHKAVHSNSILIILLLVGGGLVADWFLLNAEEIYGLIIVTAVVLVGCLIAGVYASQSSSFMVRKVKGDRIWLGGVCERYLAQLPPIPFK